MRVLHSGAMKAFSIADALALVAVIVGFAAFAGCSRQNRVEINESVCTARTDILAVEINCCDFIRMLIKFINDFT